MVLSSCAKPTRQPHSRQLVDAGRQHGRAPGGLVVVLLTKQRRRRRRRWCFCCSSCCSSSTQPSGKRPPASSLAMTRALGSAGGSNAASSSAAARASSAAAPAAAGEYDGAVLSLPVQMAALDAARGHAHRAARLQEEEQDAPAKRSAGPARRSKAPTASRSRRDEDEPRGPCASLKAARKAAR